MVLCAVVLGSFTVTLTCFALFVFCFLARSAKTGAQQHSTSPTKRVKSMQPHSTLESVGADAGGAGAGTGAGAKREKVVSEYKQLHSVRNLLAATETACHEGTDTVCVICVICICVSVDTCKQQGF